MSTRAKVALGTALAAAAAMVSYVHLKQEWEREKLHQGVLKDIERRKYKKKTQQEQVILEYNNNNSS